MQINKIFRLLLFPILLFLFFFPKPSDKKDTEFAVQRRIARGMSEQQARQQSLAAYRSCICVGFNIPGTANSYVINYRCFGLMLGCIGYK